MPDTPSFVVNDRRKFTADGELRHDTLGANTSADTQGASEPPRAAASVSGSVATSPQPVGTNGPGAALLDTPETSASPSSLAMEDEEALRSMDELLGGDPSADGSLPLGPTDEQTEEVTRAYDATVDRLDTALRAADPGAERMPEMTFERLAQSLYTQALLLLGGGAQPGETPRVDILGARQTIDMIAIIADKTRGNLTPDEDKLLQSALFDLRMGFLEITQALARQAAQRGAPGATPGGAAGFGGPLPGGGPRIVR